MKNKYRLQITLPEGFANIPIEVRCGKNSDIVVLNVLSEDDETISEQDPIYCDQCLIWNKGEFGHFALDDIVRIEASGSYSNIFLQDGRAILVSYPLNIVQQDLPKCQFIRIHRSLIINVRYITHFVGNSFRVFGELYTIGREYRKQITERFVFLGVHRRMSSNR